MDFQEKQELQIGLQAVKGGLSILTKITVLVGIGGIIYFTDKKVKLVQQQKVIGNL